MDNILPITLLISVLIHLLIASSGFRHYSQLATDSHTNKINLNQQVFQIDLIGKVESKRVKEVAVLKYSRNQSNEKGAVTNRNKTDKLVPEEVSYVAVNEQYSAYPSEQTESGSSLEAYSKPKDVDITAIPLKAVEIPILSTANKIFSLVELRIYIDKFGKVREVMPMDQNVTSQVFYSEIYKQILNIKFIPAKKAGQTVDSYLEVVFEF